MKSAKIAAVLLIGSATVWPLHAAQADLIIQTGDVSSSPTDFSTPFTNTTSGSPLVNTTEFTAFDPTLGTLNSVTVSFTLTGDISGFFKNNGTNSQSFSVYLTNHNFMTSDSSDVNSLISASFPNGFTPPSTNVTEPLDFTDQTGVSYTSVGSGQSVAYPTSGSNGFLNSPVTAGTMYTGSDVSAFESSAFDIVMNTENQVTFLGGGNNIQALLSTVEGGGVTVTYDYTPAPVPEPATLAILGTGLLGLVALRRYFS